ncbi:hypothetical protein [Maribacter sp. IgM3_T14_3]|uniref:hypothetical protein n=1 Tax=Maribacter sp. IgM3_T14_3 TaxID=3415140 RepID=UPI003C6F3802
MEENKLTDLSIEELHKKRKNLQGAIFVFIPIIIGLLYFQIRNYLNDNEIDWAMLTIVICTLGGPVTLYPELKKIKDEIANRSK